ncbi:MAG: class II aldolase/adducin family protein [Pseudonocardia sp.]|nr:class II aldolase/adducin family protein [Pseudonocardia sp.]
MHQKASTAGELRVQLADVGTAAVRSGLVLASGGNLSARLPGAEEFVVTGAGTWLDQLVAADFSTLRLSDGALLDGAPTPSTEWKLHWRTYQARPDVNAIVHLHPQHAVLVDALNEPIRLITLDHANYVRSIGRVPYHPNGSDELAEAAALQATLHNVMVLTHHGCSALGEDVGMAFRRAANLEEAATATYRLLLLGNRTLTFPVEHLARLHHG